MSARAASIAPVPGSRIFPRSTRFLGRLALATFVATAGCRGGGEGERASSASGTSTELAPATASASASPDAESEADAAALRACEARWKEIEAKPGRPFGEGVLEKDRALYLGRARGAVTLFVREPSPSPASASKERERLSKDIPGTRVARFVERNKRDKAALREALLREGYAYATDPDDAFELDARIKLTDLFDDDAIVLERGEETHRLARQKNRYETVYVYAEGPRRGKTANLLFGDRVRLPSETGAAPLHRDVLAFARREGFDRMDVVRVSEGALLAKLTYGETQVRTVLASEGAKLSVACVAEPANVQAAVAKGLEAKRWRLRAEANMREVVTAELDEALPFDRPRDEKGPDKDGFLRPHWASAYLRGATAFSTEGQTYPVYLPDGRAQPPQVCVDFVLDTYERAAGSWFSPRGEAPKRSTGRLDISSHGIENRRGVLGFKKFAEDHPELFDVRHFVGAERIPFGNRAEFFAFLASHASEFRAGDVLAIQGLKRDDRVHQHAILLEYTDPLTGFPAGLADQMKLPRRRTWEGIMAEAPKRSLLYRARPTEQIFRPLDDGSDRAEPTIWAAATAKR